MKKYDWLLFDADDTLFRFDAIGALRLLFSHYGIKFSDDDYHAYQTVNYALWQAYQRGEINTAQLQHRRFASWAHRLRVTTDELADGFEKAMLEVGKPLDGAISLLNSVNGKTKLGIITNGFAQMQKARLQRNNMEHHFEFIVISELVGIPKPHRGIFDHALSLMGNPARKNVLMIGDNLESDILGGINAEIDTCWLNTNNKPSLDHIKPHYQVSSLTELEKLITKASQ